MDTETNELISNVKLDSLSEPEKSNFTPVPRKLKREAERKLDGKESVIIPKNSKSPLAKWAAGVRKNQNANTRPKYRVINKKDI